jgi:hypothetical protein
MLEYRQNLFARHGERACAEPVVLEVELKHASAGASAASPSQRSRARSTKFHRNTGPDSFR